MAATSWAQRIIDIELAAFDKGNPVSAGQAFLLRNNLAHLIDESCQPRIAFGSLNFTEDIRFVAVGRGPQSMNTEFPLTWLDPDRPANLLWMVQLEASTGVSGPDYTYSVSIVPANIPPRGGTSAAIMLETGTAADDDVVSLEGLIDCSDSRIKTILSGAWQEVGLVKDGLIWKPTSLCMLRLDVTMEFPHVDNVSHMNHFVNMAYVREFG